MAYTGDAGSGDTGCCCKWYAAVTFVWAELLPGSAGYPTLVTNWLLVGLYDSWSFLGGDDFPTCWVSLRVGRIAESGIHLFYSLGGPLGRGGLIWLASLA